MTATNSYEDTSTHFAILAEGEAGLQHGEMILLKCEVMVEMEHFFQTILGGNFDEGQTRVLKLPHWSPTVIDDFMDFVKRGILSRPPSIETLHFATLHCLIDFTNEIVEKCERTRENCRNYLQIANDNKLTNLQEKIQKEMHRIM
jgi:hypothetical protein